MDKIKLKEMVEKFVEEIPDSPEIQKIWTDCQRRSQRAQSLLTTSQIPSLTEEQIKEIFSDSDAFKIWENKDWGFNSRLQSVGLDGLRQALMELVSRAERGLTPDDLKHIWEMKGLGILLSTELLSYRFPLKYWTYSKSITLLALQQLQEDIKSKMPHGQRSDAYIYFSLEPHIIEIRQALSEAGLVDVDNVISDIFLWWLSKFAKSKQETTDNLTTNDPTTSPITIGTRYWKVSPGKGASVWPEFQKREVIAVHFFKVGDISQLAPIDRIALKEEIKKSDSKAEGTALGYAAKQLWMFYNDMKIGDLVCAYGNKTVVGWGEIIGDYEYQEDDLVYCHRRKVKWLSDDIISVNNLSPELQEKLQQVRTIVELSNTDFEEIKSAPTLEEDDEKKDSNEPAIIDVDASVIEQAMRDFDANKREEEEWEDWESNQNHKYAILWQGQKYPIREIVRMATGGSFNNIQSRPYVLKRGFQIVSLRNDITKDNEDLDTNKNPWPSIREDETRAGRVIERFLPNAEIRKSCLEMLTNSIITANQLFPDKWGITLYHDCVFLNVGRVAVVTIRKDKEKAIERCWIVLDSKLVSTNDRISLETMAEFTEGYKSIPSTIGISVKSTGLAHLKEVMAVLSNAHIEAIKTAGNKAPKLPKQMKKAYSSGVIAYLRSYLGRDIPDPTYITYEDNNDLEVEKEKILSTLNTLEVITSSFTAKGLHFTKQQIATFYTALQIKGFVILSGISGTGKTKLAQHFASLLPQPIEADFLDTTELISKSSSISPNRNWLFMSVRPDWRDSKSLLGYYNPLIGTYEWTPFLKFLLRAVDSYQNSDGLAWFVILDEMNLAHVEYYFADILSVIESGREKGWSREPLRFIYPEDAKGNLPPVEIFLPPNLYFVGTVNVDETTHAFSAKVLDRAFTLELTEADFSNYSPSIDGKEVKLDETIQQAILDSFTFNGQFAHISKHRIGNYLSSKPQIRTWLQNLNSLLKQYNMHFGYRIFDEIVAFLSAAESNELFEDEDLGGFDSAFDLAILMKVLPKFHGSRSKLESPLRDVLAWCLDPDTPQEETIIDTLKQVEIGNDVVEGLGKLKYHYPFTAERVRRMLWLLYTDGFAAFG